MPTTALILIDLQTDFLPGGALAVPEGDLIIPLLHSVLPRYPLVCATQDWHPAYHGSFAANHPGHAAGEVIDLHGLPQILWPTHCVQHTPGAALAPALHLPAHTHIFQKGTDPTIDSYSGFFDNGHRRATGLGDFLHAQGVTHLVLAGLATDYCVKFTALDARRLGFETTLLTDACRGVNLTLGDSDRALQELAAVGVQLTTTIAV